MPSKNEPQYHVCDHLQASINNKICDAMITAIVETTSAVNLHVAFGHDQVAIIHEWEVVKEETT
jgi:hypothetical protein